MGADRGGLAGRDAIAVAARMRAHPSIEIVARDRAGAYSERSTSRCRQPRSRIAGIRSSNLRDNVERLLYRLGHNRAKPPSK
ncbi:hypothetical protein ACTMU2_14965 [Cupriavidus basilensis]